MASVLKVDTIKSLAGNEAITISESGVPQLNVPAFRAYLSSDQSITSGVSTKVNINSVSGNIGFDTNSWFDTTNKRYVPQIAGYYQITGTIRVTGSSITRVIALLFKNGVQYEQGMAVNPSSTTSAQHFMVSSIVYLNGTTDYVELWGTVIATSPAFDIATASEYATCFLSGFLVRAA
jgi:hypothetical protein